MKKKILLMSMLVTLLLGCITAYGIDYTNIYLVGDSVTKEYDSAAAPMTGWGQKFAQFLPDTALVHNHAESGRSTKSFIAEGRFDTILRSIGKNDILLVNMGHNDQSTDPARMTDLKGYKENLKTYIDGAKGRGAIPVLISPVERRRFDNDGHAVVTLLDRAQAMKEVAESEGVCFIDVQAATLKWWDYLGIEGTKKMFNHLEAGESPNYPNGVQDDTHLNTNGATKIAQLIAHEIGKLNLPISADCAKIVSPIPAEALVEKDDAETSNEENDGQTDVEENSYKPVTFDSEQYLFAATEANALGVLNGYTNGSIGAMDLLTRAQFSALMERVFSLSKVSNVTFSDLPNTHWAYDSISSVCNKGLASGYNGYFYPDNTVTFAEAAKMIVEAFGMGEQAQQKGGYPWGYLMVAAELGITKNMDCIPDDRLNRGMAAYMLVNSIYTELSDGSSLADKVIKNVYFVSPDGSDGNDGSYKAPWSSLAKAVSSAPEGSTVVLAPGTYQEETSSKITADNLRIICPALRSAQVVYAQGGIEISADNVLIKGLSLSYGVGADISSTDIVYVSDCNNVVICENDINASVYLNKASGADIFNNGLFEGEEKQSYAISLDNGANESRIYNNTVRCSTYEKIGDAVTLKDVSDCSILNNTVIGTVNGVSFEGENRTIVVKNNIFASCTGDAYDFVTAPRGFTSDYNAFDNTYPKAMEANSKFETVMFASEDDYRVTQNSVAANNGENLSSLGISFVDRYGSSPEESWSMGAYQQLSDAKGVSIKTSGRALLSENFSSSLDNWKTSGGEWLVDNGKYMQITMGGRQMSVYGNGFGWGDYTCSLDVLSPKNVTGYTTGIVFRCDESLLNFYVFRIYENKYLELAEWTEGTFRSIEQWEYPTTNNTVYNLKVKVEGNTFTMFVNGKEVKTITDYTHEKGSVGCYTYKQECEFDNMIVAE